jgi:glycosyltransferase involved in cell wall biosynthesis
MISVIIPTLDSERALLPTLAALVPGAMEGLVSEVIVADGGSRDDTAIVADAAGCNFRVADAPLGERLKDAASAARAPWLLFLRPGIILDPSWVADARRFVEQFSGKDAAAVFRRGAAGQRPVREALSMLAAALGARPRPRPEQGLLISRRLYDTLGGHTGHAADPEADLIARIGGRRIARLAAGASPLLD